MDNIWLMLLLQLVLIALNAIFACAEIAVISINENKLEKMEEEGNKRAKKLRKLTKQPAKFLATIQVAITLSGFLGSAFAAENFSGKIVNWLISLGVTVNPDTLNTISVIVITLILSYVTLIFGELVPKRVAMHNAEKLSLAMASMISFIAKLFAPLVFLLTASTNGVLRLLRIDPNENEDDVSEEDIKIMVDAGSKQGTIDKEEKTYIQNIFEFDDLTAGEIATHRTDVSVLWQEDTVEDWISVLKEDSHSVHPVCSETRDNVIGIIKTKDFFLLEDKSKDSVLKNAVKPAYFVPESVTADVLFENMKKTRNTFAVVLDEYGGMFGIVTITDVIEQLVGEFSEEPGESEIEMIGTEEDPIWKIKGVAAVSDVEEELKVELPECECDTFGGYIFSILGLIPDDGTELDLVEGRLSIHVAEITDHQILSTLVKVLPKENEEEKDKEKEKEKE